VMKRILTNRIGHFYFIVLLRALYSRLYWD
jgi:hypothetical protein